MHRNTRIRKSTKINVKKEKETTNGWLSNRDGSSRREILCSILSVIIVTKQEIFFRDLSLDDQEVLESTLHSCSSPIQK